MKLVSREFPDHGGMRHHPAQTKPETVLKKTAHHGTERVLDFRGCTGKPQVFGTCWANEGARYQSYACHVKV